MSQHSTTTAAKVVSINTAGRERNPGQRLINECIDRFDDALCDWLAEIRPAIAEEFLSLADGTRERPLQARYLDLRKDIEQEWPSLIDAFRRTFASLCAPPTVANQLLDLTDFDSLQLIDDEELSERIVVREFAAQLAESCDDELYLLDRRIASLYGREAPIAGENPLGPTPLCQALADACAALESDAEDRLLLMRRLERHLHLVLPAFYHDINRRLAERGILPDLKRSFRRSVVLPANATNTANTAGAMMAGTGVDAAILPSGAGILDVLQRLAAARTVAMLPGAQIPAGNAADTPALAPADVPNAASVSQAFLASLNEVQHTAWHPVAGVAINQVQQVRDSEAGRQASPLESVTIDIVAMLFDFIFNDDELPVSVKALVGRLQIPVLKVAMLDQSFFANRQHPARRFLDGIVGVALHWGAGGEDDAFHQRLAALVERIQNEFETNVAIFGEAIGELELFVTAREAEEEETLAIATDAIGRRELEESAWERAHAAIAPVLARNMPPSVRQFLSEHWTRILQQTALQHEASSPAWQDMVEVATQLTDSIQPKNDPDQRLQLISVLPTLLARLNRGLDLIDSTPAERRPFFDALVELHAGALKGAMVEALADVPPYSPQPAPIEATGDGDLLVTRTTTDGVAIEEVMLVGAPPMRRARDRNALEQVAALKRGDWLDFIDSDGNVTRERLNWISPRKGILVFSNHRAARAISISPEALARQLRDGAARIASDDSAIERALGGVMRSLQLA